MRKSFIFYAVILFSLAGFGELSANIDNLSNMSAEWIRTGNRNAATDAADIVVYNPGAITELADGFQIDLGNQTLIRKPSHTYNLGTGSKTYEQDGIDWFLPSVYMTYNRDDWAVFGGYYIPGGGATVNYPDGSIDTDIIGQTIVGIFGGGYSNGYIKAKSIYNTFTLGGAYKFNDMISAAVGIRYISVKNNIKAGITSTALGVSKEDADLDGNGYGGIAGINVNITPELNFGVQYQTEVNLDLKYSVKRDDLLLFTDGKKTPRDLPAVLGLGFGYDITKELYVEADYSYWFQKNADWDKYNGKDISNMAGDAQSMGVTGSYKILPEFLVSAGVVYTDFLWKDMKGYYEANFGSYEVLYTDNVQVSGGIAYTIIDNIVLNLGLSRTIWQDTSLTNTSIPGVKIKTKNSTTVAAVGLKMSF